MPTWRAAQRAASASMSWSGANALLVPVRHSRIRFPSILNSAPREVVGRQARTRVRNGLSGESGRITTLRVEASSESTARDLALFRELDHVCHTGDDIAPLKFQFFQRP